MDTQELQRIKNQYNIIGNDAALNRALEMAVAIAPTDLTVLVTGESGVGKENIPSIIHKHSSRKNGKFFALNCGAIPEGTIDAELFGHEKGSFTGAIETRKGYFEEYDGGTLFLDEIGELPLASQAKLLRVLQSGEFVKVGSSKIQKTDVRVIAATNVNLLHAVSQGKFREDLYYRLNAVQISMPSLRERKEDIYLLFRKFSSDFSEKWGLCKVTLTNDAIDLLINYRWPGNIRQLKNVTEAVTALESERITPASQRCMVDALTLMKYMPKEDPVVLPVAASEVRGGESIPDQDKQRIIKAIFDLKQEIDALKARLDASTVPVHAAPALKPAMPAEEAEWQGPGAPVTSESIGRTVDVKTEAPDLSIRRSNLDIIVKALEKHGGNRKLAAEEVGISERTLYRWIEKYNLDGKSEK
ncbi:MAG: sigma-54-dependent Fis family transcriptional regulator [Bacteroidales bacterium]|nr:sigma-54-dependent Fis family transcriptional regulator [Candidatus Cryptobacteroides faecihippi]